MAGLDLFSIQEVIAAHIRAEFPAYEVKEDDIIDDEYILRLNNNVKPFIILRWGSLMRQQTNTSFVGVRADEYTSMVDVIVVAPNARIARQASNMINDKLIGWRIPGGSQLTPAGNGVWAVPDKEGKPHLYISDTQFNYAVNFDGVGEYITP
jgi:hypothetical protein